MGSASICVEGPFKETGTSPFSSPLRLAREGLASAGLPPPVPVFRARFPDSVNMVYSVGGGTGFGAMDAPPISPLASVNSPLIDSD